MRIIYTFFCLTISCASYSQANDVLQLANRLYTPEKKLELCRVRGSLICEVNMPPTGIPRVKRDTSDLVLDLKGKKEGLAHSLAEMLQRKQGCGIGMSKAVPDTAKAPQIRLRCGLREVNTKPLLVIDNVLFQNADTLGKINPNDIASINIINGPEAMAIYGAKAGEGVIIVRMRKTAMRYDKITIRDMVDKGPIAKATVSFVFPERKDTLRYIADDSGVVVSNSLPKLEGCEMIVTATGYQKQISRFSFSKQQPLHEVLLSRDIKTCKEVIIAVYPPCRCIRCFGCRGTGYRVKADSIVERKNNPGIAGFKIYPNPVAKGGLVSIEYPVTNEYIWLSVTGIDGRMLLHHAFNTGGKEELQTGSWPGGIYTIRLLYANGRVAASQKIVIQ